MANEITIKLTALLQNGSLKRRFAPGQLQFDQAAAGAAAGVALVGTADEALAIGDLDTEGFLFLLNLDDAEDVLFGPQVGTGVMELIGKLKPGEPAMLRVYPGVTIMLRAGLPDTKVWYEWWED